MVRTMDSLIRSISQGILTLACWAFGCVCSLAAEPIEFHSPGFPPTRMDAAGQLVEDWGTVGVRILGEGLADGPVNIEAIQLDQCVPAVRAVSDRGPVRVSWTAFRAPAFPAGVDVLTVRVEEKANRPAQVRVALDLPPQVKIGLTTARIENRIVLSLPLETLSLQAVRDWGYCNETTAMPGWAKPEGPADPAFANIRAGMGGIPILYRFKVEPRGQVLVVLGLCESHWDRPRIRPILCEVEGAPPQQVDPIAKWGRHKPGVLLFRARDIDGDGQIEVAVRPVSGAADRNPILNVIWVFPPQKPPDLNKLIAGQLNQTALRYVDVGGPNDQCFYQIDRLEYPVSLPAGGIKEMTFFVACPGGSAPIPETTSWTPELLRQAAREVWQAWKPQ